MAAERIGELLVKHELITQEQLDSLLNTSAVQEKFIGTVLVDREYIKEEELVSVLSEEYGVPVIELDDFSMDMELYELIPENLQEQHGLLPIVKENNKLTVAMFDPSNMAAINELKFITGLEIQVVLTSERIIRIEQEKLHDDAPSLQEIMSDLSEDEFELVDEDEDINLSELQAASEDAPVVKLVNAILTDAIRRNASDIHVEPFERIFRVRFRVDGVLHEIMRPPLQLKNAITSRMKIMANLDISERRLPQDGRIKMKLGSRREMDFRVNTLPTLFGEKVVLRLLDKSNLQLDMTKLGFFEEQLVDFQDAINRPQGMVLVTGPTGSGKTTTLYSALSELNRIDTNISTAEDPVEFNLSGINQAQMNDEIGFNFASALRSFLRQDPDIIMVGEIRDYETAEIAIKASLTGHLVLSTLHTNGAPETVSRLLNMGVEPFLVASALTLVVAQRLGRKVCTKCAEPDEETTVEELIAAGLTEEEAKAAKPHKGAGCDRCAGTGYKGRVAFYEVMTVKAELKDAILSGLAANELAEEAVRLGMISLRRSGLLHIMEGNTTMDEVLRVTVGE